MTESGFSFPLETVKATRINSTLATTSSASDISQDSLVASTKLSSKLALRACHYRKMVSPVLSISALPTHDPCPGYRDPNY